MKQVNLFQIFKYQLRKSEVFRRTELRPRDRSYITDTEFLVGDPAIFVGTSTSFFVCVSKVSKSIK